MAKGIIVLEEIPRSCIECPMCYHATDMSIGKFQYERLYRCGLEPEDVEQVYLEDICHKKPDWCPVRVLPEMAHHEDYCDNGRYDKGWNDCLNEIEGKMCMKQCCGTCKWHKYNKSGEDWECSNIFADDCGDYTPYVHYCDEYEERELWSS